MAGLNVALRSDSAAEELDEKIKRDTLLKRDHRCAGGREGDSLKPPSCKGFQQDTGGLSHFICSSSPLNWFRGHCLHEPPFHVRKGRGKKKQNTRMQKKQKGGNRIERVAKRNQNTKH